MCHQSSQCIFHEKVNTGQIFATFEKMKAVNDLVCRRLRTIRRMRGLSASELANLAGIPRSSYISMENGDYRISLDRLAEVLWALKLDISDVWPIDDAINALGQRFGPSFRLQRFRLSEIVRLSDAAGGVLFRRLDKRVEPLMAINLDDIRLEHLAVDVILGKTNRSPHWFKRSSEGFDLLLFLEHPASLPGDLRALISRYLLLWQEAFAVPNSNP